MGADRRRDPATWLLNPFHYLSGESALPLGLLAIALTGVVGFLRRIHVDGVLDVHIGRPAPLWFFIVEGVIDWLSLTILLGLAALLLSRSRVRLIDLAGMQALARTPQLLAVGALALSNFKCGAALFKATPTADCGPAAVATFGLAIVVMMFAGVWMVALMYRAFAVACNVGGLRAAVAFVAALITAEILSKVLIVVLVRASGGA